MKRNGTTKYTLGYHLKKIQDTRIKRMYRDLFDYASERFSELEVTFNSEYTYLRTNGRWFVRLFAQKTKMAFDVRGKYIEYPNVSSIKEGSEYSTGSIINYHVDRNSSIVEIHTIFDAAFEKVAGHPPAAARRTKPTTQKIVFLNIGWMKFYQGLPGDDTDRIQFGGSFVDKHGFGFEIFNFHPFAGKVYGYVQPPHREGKEGRIAIKQLGASLGDNTVSDVLAVFVAKSPKSKVRRVVGWYKNATVFRDRQPPPNNSGHNHGGNDVGYYLMTEIENQCLLSESEREATDIVVPAGKTGGMGRSNVWYAKDVKYRKLVRNVSDLVTSFDMSAPSRVGSFQEEVQKSQAKDLPKGPVPRPGGSSVKSQGWKKDPSIAKSVIHNAGYLCELNQDHKTFTSRNCNENYVEAHHLIPMSVQSDFSNSLDVAGNIIPLCPTCHRLLHFAKLPEKTPVLKKLYKIKRSEFLTFGIDITLKGFLNAYGISR